MVLLMNMASNSFLLFIIPLLALKWQFEPELDSCLFNKVVRVILYEDTFLSVSHFFGFLVDKIARIKRILPVSSTPKFPQVQLSLAIHEWP